jgi:hypothetical protein
VIDLFEGVQRHELVAGERPPVDFTTDRIRLQRTILNRLRIPTACGD